MATAPQIVSLWQRPDRNGFLCSGLLLGPAHILTVKHAFEGMQPGAPVYVRLIDGVDGDVAARVVQRHQELDAAILELASAVAGVAPPNLLTRANLDFTGRDAVLRVIDPDNYGRSSPPSFGVAGYDHDAHEYIVMPENARGHSGGVLEVDGLAIGLLVKRASADPLCRAIAMHRLQPWLDDVLRSPAPVCAPGAESAPRVRRSGASLELARRVRERIRAILRDDCPEQMTRFWGGDPLGGRADAEPAEQLPALIDGLFVATRKLLDAARTGAGGPDRLGRARTCGLRLISELLKLAVDAGDANALDKLGRDPMRLHVACRFPGTADAVYFAVEDLPNLLQARPRSSDIASAYAVHHDDLIAGGQGEDLRAELLSKLWVTVMDEALPARIEPKHEQQLIARIARHDRRDGRRYLFAAAGTAAWLNDSDYRRWADQLRIGLVLYEDGDCPLLLVEEAELIDSVREYLTLLETH
jgi:hypothetical protein